MSPPENPTRRERRDEARAARLARDSEIEAAAARRRRMLQLGLLVAAAVVVVIVAVVVSSGGGGRQAASTDAALLKGIPQQGVTLGRADAPVTIVEFVDPQCPFCRDYTLDELPTVVRQQVRTGRAKIELRLLSFLGPDSVTAARALAAAGLQDKLWNAAEQFYANQREENSGYVDEAFLRKVLGAVPGLDVDRALDQAGSAAVSSQLAEAQRLAARNAVGGTPTILVGPTGGKLQKDAEGTATAAGVGRLVDAAMAAAKQ
jgi:protein-disulfide isomerase